MEPLYNAATFYTLQTYQVQQSLQKVPHIAGEPLVIGAFLKALFQNRQYLRSEMSRPGSGTVHASSNVAASHLLGNYLT